LLGGAWAAPAAGGDAGGEPASKKARKGPQKRVAWRAEHDLVAVRWFIKDDPPAQVRKLLRYCCGGGDLISKHY
jgi:hypothetical protein